MIKILINGTEYRGTRAFYIQEQSGNKTQSQITVQVEDQPEPVSGDIIEMQNGADTIFWGVCGIPKSPKFATGHEDRIYTIICGNANSILANRIANVAYQNLAVSEIVRNLYTQYIAEENVRLGVISDIPLKLKVYTAADFNLQSALNELAELVGATWQITNDRVFNFIVQEDFPRFPRTIDTNFLLGTALQHATKDYKTRTVQYISGAKDTTDPQTETFIYTGETDTFTVAFPISVRPAITVNGAAVDPSLIGVNGFDNGKNKVFYFSNNSPSVTYDVSSRYLTEGDEVAITYIGYFPIRISVSNDSKIAEVAALTGTSGKREQVRISPDISSLDDAYMIADQLLERYSEVTGEVSLWLLSSQLYANGLTLADTDILTQVAFDLPQFGIEGDFVITERKVEPFFANLDDLDTKLKISLKLKNRDFLKSYGEIFSELKGSVSKLSIRDDDNVLQAATISETIIFSERMIAEAALGVWPTEQILFGSLFVPMDFGATVYPVL